MTHFSLLKLSALPILLAAGPAGAAPGSAAALYVAAAAAATAACPPKTLKWRVTVAPSPDLDGDLAILLAYELRPGDRGRYRVVSWNDQPPLSVVEIGPDPNASPKPDRGWRGIGAASLYEPAYTQLVLRCAGRQLARLPIPRPR